MTTCPACGGEVYATLASTFGSTGWFTSQVQYRHVDTGLITCSTPDATRPA